MTTMQLIITFVVLLYMPEVYGHGHLLAKYKESIQSYIMTGYEGEWRRDCDMLSENSNFPEEVLHLKMDMEHIFTLDMKSALSHSLCLLVNYDVRSEASLSALMDFGWEAINHVRMALVIKMYTGTNLEMASNTSNLPFLVVAELEDGREQFLCPVVGDYKPHLGYKMCSTSLLHYQNKELRIGLMGTMPDFVMTPDRTFDGSNIMMIKMMSKRLKFHPNITITPFTAALEQVRLLHK